MSEDQKPARRAVVLATAAWTQLHGLTQAYQAAVLREDHEEAERLRIQAHDLLDSTLDLNAEAANLTREIIGG